MAKKTLADYVEAERRLAIAFGMTDIEVVMDAVDGCIVGFQDGKLVTADPWCRNSGEAFDLAAEHNCNISYAGAYVTAFIPARPNWFSHTELISNHGSKAQAARYAIVAVVAKISEAHALRAK